MRAANVFGPSVPAMQEGFTGNTGHTVPLEPFGSPVDDTNIFTSQEPSIDQRMRELYTPETRSIDMMNEMINSMPQRRDPTKMQKFGATLAGIADGPRGAFDFLEAPRAREMSDWKAKFDPVKDIANQERYANQGNRMFADSVLRQERAQDTLDLNRDKLEQKTKTDAEKLKISQQRAAAYEYRIKNPNSKFEIDKQGRIIALNPQTNKMEYVVDPEGNPVLSQHLSDEEKLNMKLSNRLAAIDAQADASLNNALTVESARDKNDKENIALRGNEARKTRATPSGNSTGNKGELPTQTRIRKFNRANEALREHPECSKFINIGQPGTNDFTITPPSTG
jgi:hypothetical protein